MSKYILIAVLSLLLIACVGEDASEGQGGSGSSVASNIQGEFKSASETGLYAPSDPAVFGEFGECYSVFNYHYFESANVLVYGDPNLPDSDFKHAAALVEGQLPVAFNKTGFTEQEFKKLRPAYSVEVQRLTITDYLITHYVRTDDGLDEQEIQRFQSETERLAGVLMEHLAPDVVAVFADASDEQLTQLYKALDKDGERYRKRYVKQSLQQQQESQVDDVIDTIERWTGSLNDEQTLLVSQWGAQYQPMGDELYQAGIKWRTEFKETLNGRGEPEQYSLRLTSLLTTPDFGWTEAFTLKMLENKQSLSQLYFALDKTFSDKQRKRIVSTLRDYAEDFEQLAKEKE